MNECSALSKKIAFGEAGTGGMPVLRSVFFIRFGAGQLEVLKAREER